MSMNELSVRTGAVSTPRKKVEVWRDDPFVARLRHFTEISPQDIDHLCAVVETELVVKKRRDLVLDGYEFSKLCFVKDGFAARYKLLRNGKRQIVNFIVPGDVVGLPGSFLDRAANSVIRKGRRVVSEWLAALCSCSGATTHTSLERSRAISSKSLMPGDPIPSSLVTRMRALPSAIRLSDMRFDDLLPAHVRPQRRRNRNGPVVALKIFEDRDQGPTDRQA